MNPCYYMVVKDISDKDDVHNEIFSDYLDAPLEVSVGDEYQIREEIDDYGVVILRGGRSRIVEIRVEIAPELCPVTNKPIGMCRTQTILVERIG